MPVKRYDDSNSSIKIPVKDDDKITHDDFTRTSLISEGVVKLILMPEDEYVKKKEEEIDLIAHALSDCSQQSLFVITADIVKKERARRNNHISKKKKSEIEYTNKLKMINIKAFFIKVILVMFCFIFTYSYCISYTFNIAHGIEANTLTDMIIYLLKHITS